MKVPLPLLIALQFLTRLPIRLPGMPAPEALGRSLLWYPLVGLLLGGVLLAVAVATLLCGWPGLLALASAALLFALCRRALLQRISGTTGDTAGAVLELLECLVLVALAL